MTRIMSDESKRELEKIGKEIAANIERNMEAFERAHARPLSRRILTEENNAMIALSVKQAVQSLTGR